jgi:hypothetical protein
MAKAPYEHFLLAEEALADANTASGGVGWRATSRSPEYYLALAQAHATLATVDAAVWDAAKREADAASADDGSEEVATGDESDDVAPWDRPGWDGRL